MENQKFAGLFAFKPEAVGFDNNERESQPGTEVTYVHILSAVGANHHLVQNEGENGFRLINNGELAQHMWWKDRAGAVAAFDAYKASLIDT